MLKSLTTALVAIALAVPATTALAKPDKHGDLPPGLQKKVNRGGELPPGWKKKLQRGYVLEDEIYRHAVVVHPVDDRGLVTVRIEGELVRLVHATHEIVDILSR
ncbi:hypothetical protein [Microbulbifer hydrolyticus]|uniref:RcnB family protein n=1 Tax=Microbulbifer hydrolyticus TaxID=48074 RepID=A0A6P1TBG2_9GAMM|nr:hypothetical protein [Microbulbifer hydrolyticus]MBB5211239.1 hypothetical protein [Microbulbifer hydrolyticus]QHQ37992.1 hypothetical protein GTQ55_02580 [Microbulbifer hydrolyticus]